MDIRVGTLAPQRPTGLPARSLVAAPTPRPSIAARPGSYQAGIAAIQKKLAAETQLPLQKGEQSVLMAHPTPPTRGTIVMYHGFTAGPWQFKELSQRAFDAGYNVYIPRLPGHGLKTPQGVEDPSQLVKALDAGRYAAFAETTFQDAKALGGPVSVMGLSVGGEIALSVAETHAEVAKVVAYAPFMRPAKVYPVMGFIHALDRLTGGFFGRLLDHVPYGWGKQSTEQTAKGLDGGGRAGHSKFTLGNLYSAEEYGRGVIANADKIQAPVQFFTTGADTAADPGAIAQVFQRSGGAQHNGFYTFPKAMGVPHAMVSPRENLVPGETSHLYNMTMEFLKGVRVFR